MTVQRGTPEPRGGLRSVMAEALQAYELAQATRLSTEQAAAQTYRQRADKAEADKLADHT